MNKPKNNHIPQIHHVDISNSTCSENKSRKPHFWNIYLNSCCCREHSKENFTIKKKSIAKKTIRG